MDAENLLTQKEVCSRLRISPKTLQVLRRSQRIGFLRFGHRTIRFAESEIKRFEKEHQR